MKLKDYLASIGSKGGSANTTAQQSARAENLKRARAKRHQKKKGK